MSTKIKIESGIPIPMVRRKCLDFPFAEMAVGDSFAVVKAERRKLAAALHYVNHRKWHDRKYISRTVGSDREEPLP